MQLPPFGRGMAKEAVVTHTGDHTNTEEPQGCLQGANSQAQTVFLYKETVTKNYKAGILQAPNLPILHLLHKPEAEQDMNPHPAQLQRRSSCSFPAMTKHLVSVSIRLCSPLP